MIGKHGPPSFFVTVSSADSMWPEVYVELSNGKMRLEHAKKLSVTERADMAALNPVRMTIAWKTRVKAFLKLVLSGKSKTLQEITHCAHKSEWQGRLSEHKHFLFWTKRRLPTLHLTMTETFVLKIKNFYKGQNLHVLPCSLITMTQRKNQRTFLKLLQENQSHLITTTKMKKDRKELRELVQICNTHKCGGYCTRNHTTTCKSRFPFEQQETSKVVEYTDSNLNKPIVFN